MGEDSVPSNPGGLPTSAETEFLLDFVRELVAEEARRDEALNSRAVAIVAFGALTLALAAGLERGLPLRDWGGGWRYPALALSLVGVFVLAGSVVIAVRDVLRPRRFAMLSRVEVKKFLTPEYLERSDVVNRQILLRGMVEILDQERERIERKAAALGRAYLFALIAIVCVAALASLAALNASGIIGTTHGAGRQAQGHSVYRDGRRETTPAGGGAASPASAARVRREGSE